jgi:hypothetical protein
MTKSITGVTQIRTQDHGTLHSRIAICAAIMAFFVDEEACFGARRKTSIKET